MKPRSAAAIRIRRGSEADIDEIIGFSHATWRHTLAQQLGVGVEQWAMIAGVMRVELTPIARAILVATRGSQIVGFSYRDGATIEDLWIDPPFQGAGIGPQLLRVQIEAMAADGYRAASLECLKANLRARRFYEREGWRPVYQCSRASPLFRGAIPRVRYEYDVWRLARKGGRRRPTGLTA